MIFAKVRDTEMGLVIQGTYNKFLNFLKRISNIQSIWLVLNMIYLRYRYIFSAPNAQKKVKLFLLIDNPFCQVISSQNNNPNQEHKFAAHQNIRERHVCIFLLFVICSCKENVNSIILQVAPRMVLVQTVTPIKVDIT